MGLFLINRKQLVENAVKMKVEVSFTYNLTTPPEVKQELYVMSTALQSLAERYILSQLDFEGLTPSHRWGEAFGILQNGETKTINELPWRKR